MMTTKSSTPTPRKPQRTKQTLSPITDEEIFGAAGMKGSQIGFLRNISPSGQPFETPSVGTETVPILSVGTALRMPAGPQEELGSDSVGTASLATAPRETEPCGTDLNPTSPVPTVIVCGPHPSQRRTPIPCSTVSQAHTAAEHRVYEFLWKAARKWGREATGDGRLLRFKQPWLAASVGMHENSVRTILKNLTRKLAIEETGKPGPAQGREIRIYDETALLERRRAKGLVWVVRSHGVMLLTAEQVWEMSSPCADIGTDIVGTESLDTP